MTAIDALFGRADRPPRCREFTADVSVHWWRNDDSGLCLCGKQRKCQHVWIDQGGPGDEWRECDVCGAVEDR